MVRATMSIEKLKQSIEEAYQDRDKLKDDHYQQAVLETIELLDKGQVRVAEKNPKSGEWEVNTWLKEAILLYFGVQNMERWECAPFEFYDKIPLKKNLEQARVRVVPPGTVRYGSFLEPGCVVMPGYVNIGAYVGSGTMVDTWATVGSCAQVGKNVHLSGGVGIGGVLEPPGAKPVIIEDGAFIGSRAILVEGVHVGAEAVLGANVVLTSSTQIIDVTAKEPVHMKGHIPPRSVVIPGTRAKEFPAGEYQIPCALIIGRRSESTDKKVSLNDALREFQVSV
ncbi:MAG: 2,3,4,5-tetrahydropyridine-2,6-dicarboxylate N-succinyltransferase [Myxococcales bacterium]|nr:MAG: 2,3,4,5-tetrahydropyridine-2,6-dicarboxylate N-succinyltransferase [Myxococcales bacterium]